MKKICIVALMAIGAIVALPNDTQAFVFQDERVMKLTEQTALISITYSVRFNDRIGNYQISATEAGPNTNFNNLTFDVYRNEEVVTPAALAAFVESEADIVNGRYQVDRGENNLQTLHVLVTVADGESIDDISVGINTVPVNATVSDTNASTMLLRGGIVASARSRTYEEMMTDSE